MPKTTVKDHENNKWKGKARQQRQEEETEERREERGSAR